MSALKVAYTMGLTGSLQNPRVSRDLEARADDTNGEDAVGNPLIQVATENATLITSILAAIAAVIAAIKGAIKLYSVKRAQINELLELPAKLKTEISTIITRLNGLEQMGAITRSALDVASWECDPSGYCVEASPALCEIFGLTREEMLGRGWLEAIERSNEREAAWNEWARSVSSHIPYRHDYNITNQRTGKTAHYTTTSRTILDADGEVVRYVGFVRRGHDNE